jgi:hypothetical protein
MMVVVMMMMMMVVQKGLLSLAKRQLGRQSERIRQRVRPPWSPPCLLHAFFMPSSCLLHPLHALGSFFCTRFIRTGLPQRCPLAARSSPRSTAPATRSTTNTSPTSTSNA